MEKNKKRYRNKEIFKVKNRIKRVFLKASKIDVRVKRLPDGKFKSFIRVLAPRKRELVAQKIDEDVKKCLKKSELAILRQINRIKTRWKKTKSKLLELALSA